ncbi:hypothetical protein BV20DRAFT_964054 [Pilatotrama ljubarskyi]|nr:hypothetical protein BV20DRAFT_964054 [Pilatotrama ljubarskyi]
MYEGMERRIPDRSRPPGEIATLKGLADCHHYLESLLRMSSLRTLEVATDVVLQLNDAFLSRLAQGLPRLEHFSLVPRSGAGFWFDESPTFPDDFDADYDYEPAPSHLGNLPTLDGLVSLVGYGERLKSLKLAVSATFSDGKNPGFMPRPNRICTMELWATPLDVSISDESRRLHRLLRARLSCAGRHPRGAPYALCSQQYGI